MSRTASSDSQYINRQVWINQADITQTKIEEKPLSLNTLRENEVVLQVEQVGFSANNISYALTGQKMGYWGFFPADEQWGIVPMWGFASVVASNCEQVHVGERFYGYYPMAGYLTAVVDKPNTFGFTDAHPQRQSNSPVYDQYLRCKTDPAHVDGMEAWLANYRPLFMTSFVLDDFVGDEGRMSQVVLTSASSKTAYGCAYLLKQHQASRKSDYQVIGLTSQANKAFTESLGCYDKVVVYDELACLERTSTWILDFAGNKRLLLDLQHDLGDALQQTLFIGATDVKSQQNKPDGKLKGQLFFAPHQVKKRMEEWGREQFNLQYAQAWNSFIKHIQPQIDVVHYNGLDAAVALYQQGLTNSLNNRQINLLTLNA